MHKDDKAAKAKEEEKKKVKTARSLQTSIMEGDNKSPVIQPFEAP